MIRYPARSSIVGRLVDLGPGIAKVSGRENQWLYKGDRITPEVYRVLISGTSYLSVGPRGDQLAHHNSKLIAGD